MLGCQVGKLPLHYLGVLLHRKALRVNDRLVFGGQNRKGNLRIGKKGVLSVAGRLVLINCVLTTIPFYWSQCYISQ